MKSFDRVFGLIFFVFTAVFSYGTVFTSSDGQFSIDMPAGWVNAKSAVENSVLSITKGASRLDFKIRPDCANEACIEQKMNDDLLDVKSRKMKVLANTYTGDEIKRVEFSTGEPFLYINFSTSKTDYSAGYFIINKRAYSVLAQNVTYAESDLYFSYISPKADKGGYDTYALPQVQEETIAGAVKDFKTEDGAPAVSLPAAQVSAPHGTGAPAQVKARPKINRHDVLEKIKEGFKTHKNFSFVSKNMPSSIRSLGRVFDIAVLVFIIYAALLFLFLVLKIFTRGGAPELVVNPASPYPIKFKRLYGTPSLIFRARDNQGATFLSFTTRWGAVFQFFGAAFIMLCVFFMCAASVNETFNFIKINQAHYMTVYSVSALILALGVFIWVLGAVIALVTLREFTLYNKNGKKSVYVLQKGYGIKKEVYTVYYAHTKENLTFERGKFSLKRKWRMFDSQGDEMAVIEEISALRSVCRKIFGHMWGLFRASYKVSGVLDSSGFIYSHHTVFNEFTANIDKPQALDALDLLVAALIINIRDQDAWHPSIN
ncbi:MAG: hypothetical protein LBI01_07040 [Elusimicrobium sp.]|jgi:hypothetical protein|nr:hypothetical protein [Elusimicrobium sp.]